VPGGAPQAGEAVRLAGQRMALMAGPRASWSIVLEARLAGGIDPDAVRSRLDQAAVDDSRLGPPPAVAHLDLSALEDRRLAFANERYPEGASVLRCAVAPGPPATLLLAAHHGAIDGLGLIGLLGVATAGRAVSSARGVGAAPPRGSITAWAAVRAVRSLASPPPRVAPAHRGAADGDHVLARAAAPGLSGGTARLTSAALRAIASWNRQRGEPAFPAVVAVGASHRGGDAITLDNQAAWLRVTLDSGDDGSTAARLAAAEPQPVAPPWRGPRLAGAAMALVAGRMGSTLLVSNLGAVSGIDGLESLAFWPVAYGRSGVAIGAASVDGQTTVTVRAPARGFTAGDARQLVEGVAAQLNTPAPDAAAVP
jgi:hypothetical protein